MFFVFSIPCMVNKISSVISVISQWHNSGFFTCLKSKIEKKIILSQSLELGSELGTTLILSQAAYEFALVINSHSHGVHRCASVNVGSFNVFSKHVSGPGHMHCILSSLVYAITLVSIYSASKPPHWLPFSCSSGFLCCLCYLLSYVPGSHSVNVYLHISIDTTIIQKFTLSWGQRAKQRPASLSLHQESNRQFKIHNHSIFFKGLH